jgi:hypothetical protein
MVIVSTKEFRENQKKYFDLAKDERVVIKKGSNFIALVITSKPDNNFVDSEWVKEFLSIPEEYRCNPFNTSPSGNLFWADKRNVEHLHESNNNSKMDSIQNAKRMKILLSI